MARLVRFERTTLGLEGRCSILLSYRRVEEEGPRALSAGSVFACRAGAWARPCAHYPISIADVSSCARGGFRRKRADAEKTGSFGASGGAGRVKDAPVRCGKRRALERTGSFK